MRWIWAFLRRRISYYSLACMALIYLIMHFNLQGIELVIRGTSVVVLQSMILYGVIIGWLLGRGKISPQVSVLISLAAGFLLVVFHVSGIDRSFWDLLIAGVVYLFRLIFQEGIPDAAELFFTLSVIETRFQEILSSLPVWGYDALSGFTVYNQISTLLSWGLILFLMSAGFAWITKRRQMPIYGVIPAGVLLAILMTYTLEKRILLALLLGAGLILIGIVNHEAKQSEWERAGIRGAKFAGERVIPYVIGLSIYAMVFAAFMPSIRINFIADPFERLVYGETDELGSGGEGSGDGGSYYANLYSIERFAGLPRQKLIGSGPELAKRVVMIVRYPTMAFVETEIPPAARYWKSYTYDRYTGSGWQSSETDEVNYRPGEEITEIKSTYFDILTQEVRLSNAIRGTLYSAGAPVTVDHEVQVSWREVDASGEAANGGITQEQDHFATTIDQIQYQVRSLISTATEDELRSPPGEVPEWIKDRYLDLPDSVPQRVLDLAAEIVTNQPTAYDQAKAIETFLRTYPYTLDLPAPPVERDIADYFLFDLQTGYCDYYATSMVVLARAVGLPARVVVGYVGGQYEVETDQYLVSEADAHSWVEIYFNEFGWIPFEPTAARALIDDQELTLPLPPELEQLPVADVEEAEAVFPWTQLLFATIVIMIISLLSWNQSDLARLRRLDGNNLVAVVLKRLYRYSRWMGLGHLPSDTLYEFSQRLSEAFKDLAAVKTRERKFTEGIQEINRLTQFAVIANYGLEPVEDKYRIRIVQLWMSLRKRMRSAVWIHFWKSTAVKVNPFKEDYEIMDDNLGNGAADGTR